MNEDEDRTVMIERVREAMARQWMNAATLAKASGVSENTISAFLNGRKHTQPAKILALLTVLGLEGQSLSIDVPPPELPLDVETFVRIATQRLSALDETGRSIMLARLYPLLA